MNLNIKIVDECFWRNRSIRTNNTRYYNTQPLTVFCCVHFRLDSDLNGFLFCRKGFDPFHAQNLNAYCFFMFGFQ